MHQGSTWSLHIDKLPIACLLSDNWQSPNRVHWSLVCLRLIGQAPSQVSVSLQGALLTI